MLPIMQESTPPSPPSTLLSLPIELLAKIAHLLDRQDVLSLARTARIFTSPTEYPIWRHLDLRLHPYHGAYALIQAINGDRPWSEPWAENIAQEVEARFRRAVKAKLAWAVLGIGARRLQLVQEISLYSRMANPHGLLYLLETVSPRLVSLMIEAPPHHHPSEYAISTPHHIIDYHSVHAGLFSPSLTYVRLGRMAILRADFILQLVRAAPNLVTLECESGYYMLPEEYGPPLPQEGPETSLRRLSICFTDSDVHEEEEAAAIAVPLLALLRQSPHLHQLPIESTGYDTEMRALVEILSTYKSLEDLHWSALAWELDQFCPGGQRALMVRRLALRSYHWADIFIPLRDMPNLQMFCIVPIRFPVNDWSAPRDAPTSPTVCQMLPSFARGLRSCPQLRVIHTLDMGREHANLGIFDRMDEVETQDTAHGRIRSFRHGADELLHATLLLEWEEHPSGFQLRPFGSRWMSPEVIYQTEDGQTDRKFFGRQISFSWYNYTDWDGLKVPMEVIEEMRLVQGASEAEWTGRGIEVGDAAWRVLEGWREEQETGGEEGSA